MPLGGPSLSRRDLRLWSSRPRGPELEKLSLATPATAQQGGDLRLAQVLGVKVRS
jgi:hypothetical protein